MNPALKFLAVIVFLTGALLALFSGGCLLLLADQAPGVTQVYLAGIAAAGGIICYGAVLLWQGRNPLKGVSKHRPE